MPSITLSDGLAAREEAIPAAGAVPSGSQLIPPLGEDRIRFFWFPLPLSEVHATISSSAFTAPSSAPEGWPSG